MLFVVCGLIDFYAEFKKKDKTDFEGIINYLQDSPYSYSITLEKFPIIFYSNEKLMSSCEGMILCNYNYPEYEKIVKASKNFAIIVPANTKIHSEVLKNLNLYNITFVSKEFKSTMENVHDETDSYNISSVVVYKFPLTLKYRPIDFNMSINEVDSLKSS